MTEWMIWFSLAGVLVAVEIFTGTFFFLMLAIGLAAGGVLALFSVPLYVQLLVAGLTVAVELILLRKGRLFAVQSLHPQRNPAVLLDIGQTVDIEYWNDNPNGVCTSRASYRGAQWDVELLPDAKKVPGCFIIREIRGATLCVENAVQDIGN